MDVVGEEGVEDVVVMEVFDYEVDVGVVEMEVVECGEVLVFVCVVVL